MSIQLIAIDMDGTLLGKDTRISAENARAVQDAMDAGIQVMLCSGRPVQDIALMAGEAGLEGFWVGACNGTLQMDPWGREIARHTFAPQISERMVELLRPLPLVISAFLPDRIVFETPAILSQSQPRRYLARNEKIPVCTGVAELYRACRDGMLKIVAFDTRSQEETPAVREARSRMETLQEVGVTSSGRNNVELIPAGVDKGHAVREVANRLGLRAEQVMAIGDQHNDLPMLEWAGVGVAMGNALPQVRGAADHITLGHDQDGVALAIRRWGLQEGI